jgi:hypothetical protein
MEPSQVPSSLLTGASVRHDVSAILTPPANRGRFERESFGALHQMLGGVPETARAAVWDEIEEALTKFETEDGFVGPCELLVASAAA